VAMKWAEQLARATQATLRRVRLRKLWWLCVQARRLSDILRRDGMHETLRKIALALKKLSAPIDKNEPKWNGTQDQSRNQSPAFDNLIWPTPGHEFAPRPG